MEAFNALFNRAQQGNMAACGALVRRFQDMALGYAYAILGDVHLAEDAVQDAFIEPCLNMSRVYGPKAFPAFLRKVIYKHCDRVMRKRRPEVTLEDAPALPSPGTPEQELEHHETARQIHRAFMTLPLPERQAVVLFYINRRKRQEIAAFLDLPLETIIYRLRNARKKMRKEMDTMTPDHFEGIIAQPVEKAGKVAFTEIEAEEPHPDLALYVGKLKTLSSMGINLLHHSLDVAHLAGLIAAELGLNVRLAQRSGLLHDIGKSAPNGKNHVEKGVELGLQYNEHPVVRDVIATHHDKNDHLSAYAFAVKAADFLAAGQIPQPLEATVPQVINLQRVASAQDRVQAVHAVRVLDEMWVLIRGTEPINADAFADPIRNVLNVEIPIRITVAPTNRAGNALSASEPSRP